MFLMSEEVINRIIENYEKRLQERNGDFKLTPFEKIIMKESMIYGYEYRQNEL